MDNLGIILVLLQTIYYTTCSVYLHEPSRIYIKPPNRGPNDQSKFGFAMSYQYGNSPKLVIGAPRNTYVGKVFSCPMEMLLDEVTCDGLDIDVEKMGGGKRGEFPDQNYYFGGSIAGTKDYFVACAPLLTAELETKDGIIEDLFGTCIVYNNTAYRYQGTFEQFTQNSKNLGSADKCIGGSGWSTLVDEYNHLLIIMKTNLHGDIMFVSLDDPLKPMSSVKTIFTDDSVVAKLIDKYTNIGFGITSGKYFNTQTMYAFSVLDKEMIGGVAFLKYDKKKHRLQPIINEKGALVLISDSTVGSMFGTALCSADLNLDKFSDILIGAPTHIAQPYESEIGAVHIFIGGHINKLDEVKSRNRRRTILGTKDFARFGAALAATDIDGDGYPEIFIGAPYADSGKGILYVLSGIEVYKILLLSKYTRTFLISDFTQTQIVKSEKERQFGYSLLVVPDRDKNGCDELAVGAPGSSAVLLYRCLPTINVTLSTKLMGPPIVKETDNDFTIEICINVNFSMKTENIYSQLEVSTTVDIRDKAKIEDPKYFIDLKIDKDKYCDNVTVTLVNNDPGVYTFKATVNISENMNNNIYNNTEFNNTWVILRAGSKTEETRKIERNCGDNCRPIWNITMAWSGESDSYDLGSGEPASVTVIVHNTGNNSYVSCLLIQVVGATTAMGCPSYNDGYKCDISPLIKNDKRKIDIDLNMDDDTNFDSELYVDVKLYENNCNEPKPNDLVSSTNLLRIPYNLTTDRVQVNGIQKSNYFTDQDILENENYIAILHDNHEYVITNKKSITWKNISAVLVVDKQPFLGNVQVSLTENDAKNCTKEDMVTFYNFNCTMDLKPKTSTRIIVISEITKKNIMDYVVDNKFNTSSHLELHLQPTNKVNKASSMTVFYFKKELNVGNNITMIILLACLVALVILTIIILILYKINFFKRKEKKDLKDLRESVRRHSIKKSTSSSKQKTSTVDDSGIMDLVIEEDPFDEPVSQESQNHDAEETTKEDVVLIQEKAQVHC